jgi:hypothetical protein
MFQISWTGKTDRERDVGLDRRKAFDFTDVMTGSVDLKGSKSRGAEIRCLGEWKTGRVAEWKNGRMEERKNGRMEERKSRGDRWDASTLDGVRSTVTAANGSRADDALGFERGDLLG